MTTETKAHLEVLSELLRDVNLEKRMETLIKTESILRRDPESVDKQNLQSIKLDLEEDLLKVRKMIFMVEKAEYWMEA